MRFVVTNQEQADGAGYLLRYIFDQENRQTILGLVRNNKLQGRQIIQFVAAIAQERRINDPAVVHGVATLIITASWCCFVNDAFSLGSFYERLCTMAGGEGWTDDDEIVPPWLALNKRGKLPRGFRRE